MGLKTTRLNMKKKIKKIKQKVNANIDFLSGFIANPREVGSLVPSSKFLGRGMAAFIEDKSNCHVIELGAGTGTITNELLHAGIQVKDLTIIECSSKLIGHLHKKFPGARIIHGNAINLRNIISEHLPKLRKPLYIISSLPFKSIPEDISLKIVNELHALLSGGGVMIQYTYDLTSKKKTLLDERLNRTDSKIVWRNFPPARINVYQHNAQMG